MPSVKIPRKSTATDMTPFVDVAFLILSFFMLATKFKPPAPVTIATPHSVSTEQLKEQDAIQIEFDSSGRVFYTLNLKSTADLGKRMEMIQGLNNGRKLGLSQAEMQNFLKDGQVGTPLGGLKNYLALPDGARSVKNQPGIPVDSTNNELIDWVRYTIAVFPNRKLNLLVKGDNNAKYPAFKGVIDAFRKNEQFKYQMITDPEMAPPGTELYTERSKDEK